MSAAFYPQVQKIYVAYYGRPADPAGLQYWAGQLAANGGNLTSIINAFGASAESTALYAGADNSAKVTAIYQQLFNRAPDAAGLAFYTAELTANRMTASSIALNVANGAQGTDATYLNNKVTVATSFTDSLTLDSTAAVAYTGTTATTAARSLITGVTTSAATTNVASTITSIKAGGGAAAGQTFTLTTSATPDVVSGTTGNDTITGGAGTFATTDVISDGSTTDRDVFNLAANTALGGTGAIVTNVEVINATGEYASVQYNAASTTATKQLNLAAGVTASTATVTGARATGVAEIVAGANVGTLNISSGTTGTVGTIKVNTGNATAATLTGTASVADSFDVTVSKDLTSLGLALGTGVDSATVTLVGNTMTLSPNAGSVETLTLVSNGAANTITINGALVDNAATSKASVVANQNIVIIGDPDNLTGLTVEKSGSGRFTFRTNAGATAMDLSKVAADIVDINTATTAVATTYNVGSTVKLSLDNNAASYNVDNAAGTLTSGTLNVNVDASQTALTSGAKVDTLRLNADTANVTVTTLTANAATNTVVATGSKNLTITTFTNNGDEVLTAGSMTGRLTVGTTGAASTIVGGAGADTIAVGDFANTVIRGGAGNDSITGASGNASSLFGDDGGDTVTGGSGADVIDGGAGDDVVTGAAGADTISGGLGNDIINGGAGADTLTGGTGADVFQFSNVFGGVREVQTIDLTGVTSTTANLFVGGITVTTVSAADAAAAVATKVAAALNGAAVGGIAGAVASANGTVVTVTFGATSTGADAAALTVTGAGTITGTPVIAEVVKGVNSIAAADSSEGTLDAITDWIAGDKIDLTSAITLDTTAVTGTTTAAGLSTAGLISFSTLTTQPATLNAAATLVAAAVAGGSSTAAGEAAVFVYDGATYVFVSDGTAAYNTTTDMLIKLNGISATSGITLFGGDIIAIA